MSLAEENKLLPATQSGFRPNRSCHDHILRICQHVTNGFNNKEKTAAVFFNREEAFDKASHERIIIKLKNLGINHNCLNWIINFLKDRTYMVS